MSCIAVRPNRASLVSWPGRQMQHTRHWPTHQPQVNSVCVRKYNQRNTLLFWVTVSTRPCFHSSRIYDASLRNLSRANKHKSSVVSSRNNVQIGHFQLNLQEADKKLQPKSKCRSCCELIHLVAQVFCRSPCRMRIIR